jgi:glycosyltransferase involved in cell wall biosynthesis
VIFHFSIPCSGRRIPAAARRKVVRYHNITPAHFLEGVYPAGAERCRLGRRQLPQVAAAAELGLGVSAYNCAELTEAGCASVAEVPILLDLAVLETPPDPRTLSRLGDGRPLVLHVGRIVPNKRIEDLIKTHVWLTRLLPGARLLLVGGGENNAYGLGLKQMVRELRVPGVRFAGHVSNAVMTASYRAAGVYLCLSEQRFCVPLVEAMHFGLPIVARAAAGVQHLGGGGILLGAGTLFTGELLARFSRRRTAARTRARSGQREAFRPPSWNCGCAGAARAPLGLGTGR